MSDPSVLQATGAWAAESTGKAGPVGLFVVVLLCVAAYFLFRSMSRHLKRVPADFPADQRGEAPGGAASGEPGATDR